MKLKTWWVIPALALLVATVVVAEPHDARPYTLINRLRIEYDSNYDQLEDNERDSLKIHEELELAIEMNWPQTYLGINLRPNIVWWDDREGDDSDFIFYADATLVHTYSRRVKMSLRDMFSRHESPMFSRDDPTYRESVMTTRNLFEGSVSILLRPKAYLDLKGGYTILRYDDEDLVGRADLDSGVNENVENDEYVATHNDYDKIKLLARARYQYQPATELSGQLQYEQVEYIDSPLTRESEAVVIAGGVEHIFNPNLMGSATVGLQQHEATDAFSSSSTSPFLDAGVTILPSPATRISLGAALQVTETDIYPYSKRDNLKGYASVSHDVNAKLNVTAFANYSQGNYDGEDLPKNATVGDLPSKQQESLLAINGVSTSTPLTQSFISALGDKDETAVLVGVKATYQMNRHHWLEAGLRNTKISSDLRDDYTRNFYHLGWKFRL